MDNYTDCKEIVTLVIIGEYLVELLPQEEGYFFSKNTLKLCWKWIEEQEIERMATAIPLALDGGLR